MEITKYVLPVVVGAMSGMILITAGENIIHHLYPLPPGTDLYNADSLAIYIRQLPMQAFTYMFINYIACSFLAGLIATLILKGTTALPALVVGIIMTMAGLYYVMNMPYPRWFATVSMITFLPLNMLGYLIARRRPAGTGA